MRRRLIFWWNGISVTLSSLLMNGVGVWFSVYLAKKVGTEEMGTFQLLLSVYAFGVTFATSGITLAVTRLVAEAQGRHPKAGLQGVMKHCFGYSFFFGSMATALLFWFSKPIGVHWLQNAQTVVPLRWMSVSLLPLAISAALNGYFIGVRRAYQQAIVQLAEQLLKIALTLLWLQAGYMRPCTAMVCAMVGSELFAWGCSYLCYRIDTRRFCHPVEAGNGRELLRIGLPIALSSYLRSGLVTLKNLLVPKRLQLFGLTAEMAVSAFGIVHGVVLPVLLFPSSFLFPFSGLVVPELAEAREKNRQLTANPRVQHILNRAIHLTLLFSIGTGGCLFFFAHPLATLISPQPGVGEYLRLLAPILPIMYLDNTVDNLLKGLNEQLFSMYYNIIDAVCCVVLVWVLLPRMGILGYLIMICFSELLNFAMSFQRLVHISSFRLSWWHSVIKPAVFLTLAALFAMWCWRSMEGSAWFVVGGISSCLGSYVFLLWAGKEI